MQDFQKQHKKKLPANIFTYQRSKLGTSTKVRRRQCRTELVCSQSAWLAAVLSANSPFDIGKWSCGFFCLFLGITGNLSEPSDVCKGSLRVWWAEVNPCCNTSVNAQVLCALWLVCFVVEGCHCEWSGRGCQPQANWQKAFQSGLATCSWANNVLLCLR